MRFFRYSILLVYVLVYVLGFTPIVLSRTLVVPLVWDYWMCSVFYCCPLFRWHGALTRSMSVFLHCPIASAVADSVNLSGFPIDEHMRCITYCIVFFLRRAEWRRGIILTLHAGGWPISCNSRVRIARHTKDAYCDMPSCFLLVDYFPIKPTN